MSDENQPVNLAARPGSPFFRISPSLYIAKDTIASVVIDKGPYNQDIIVPGDRPGQKRFHTLVGSYDVTVVTKRGDKFTLTLQEIPLFELLSCK